MNNESDQPDFSDQSRMDPVVIQQYCNKVPREIRNAVAPLSKEKSWAIFSLLVDLGPMSFTDIKRHFHTTSSGDITKYLKLLVNAGLVGQRVKSCRDVGDRAKSFYKVTNLGDALLKGLYENLLPADPLMKVNKQEGGKFSRKQESRKGEHYVQASQIPLTTAIVSLPLKNKICVTGAQVTSDRIPVHLALDFVNVSSDHNNYHEVIKGRHEGIMIASGRREKNSYCDGGKSIRFIQQFPYTPFTEAYPKAKVLVGGKVDVEE